jgi:hypothetical protein
MPSVALLLAFVCLSCIGEPLVVPGSQAGARASCGADIPEGRHERLRPPDGWLISADSVATLYSFRNLVLSHPRLSGPYPRAVVLVGFMPTATLEERRTAMERVQGRLVGGMGLNYVLVIDDDGTADPLWAAVDKLCTLPQVHHASPDIFTLGVVPAA